MTKDKVRPHERHDFQNMSEQEKKQQLLFRLVSDYDSTTHRNQFLPANHQRHDWYRDFHYLTSKNWDPAFGGRQPYVVATMLLDAYSHLPQRPDLAFNFTWSAANSAYNDLYLNSAQSTGASLNDSKSIDHASKRIADLLDSEIDLGAHDSGACQTVTVEELLRSLMRAIPRKTLHFLASYVLKGHCIEAASGKLDASDRPLVRPIHIPSSYSTFKRKYEKLFEQIEPSFGRKYLALCNPSEREDKIDVHFGIKAENADKSRKLIDALGFWLLAAWEDSDASTASTLWQSKQDWVRFPLQCILYAARNSTVHGNVPSRLNSLFSDADSVTSNAWLFLCCYVYLGLILKCSGSLELSDLAPLVCNVDAFSKCEPPPKRPRS